MAKGARASRKKANRAALRARVFAPADKARAERIHARLVATMQQPRPDEAAAEHRLPTHMDVDGAANTPAKKPASDKRQSRKQLRRKPQNKISFPSSRGKGALKPFAGARIKKPS
ncbi:hypothetical protein ACEQ8H_003046 [Pleosporales sp. CAS-2024a]